MLHSKMFTAALARDAKSASVFPDNNLMVASIELNDSYLPSDVLSTKLLDFVY